MRSLLNREEETVSIGDLLDACTRHGHSETIRAVITTSGRNMCRVFIDRKGQRFSLIEDRSGEAIYFDSIESAIDVLLDIPGINSNITLDLISRQGSNVGRRPEGFPRMQVQHVRTLREGDTALGDLMSASGVFHFEAVKA